MFKEEKMNEFKFDKYTIKESLSQDGYFKVFRYEEELKDLRFNNCFIALYLELLKTREKLEEV